MATTETPISVITEVSPHSLDAAVQSRHDTDVPLPPSEFFAQANGGLALKLMGIAREIPPGTTPEEAYLFGAMDAARTLVTHIESRQLTLVFDAS